MLNIYGKSQRAKLQLLVFFINEKHWPRWESKTGEMLAVVNIESFKTTPKNVFSKKAKISISDIFLYQEAAMACLKSTSHGLSNPFIPENTLFIKPCLA